MSILDLFKRRTSAPVARERLQLLLAYERQSRGQPDLVSILREEIMAVIAKHVQIDQDYLQVSMDRGATMSTLEIDIQIPNK
ncbi:MAG: cell division topological specificity factor MinE, partial [Mesorhizobium sp.]